MSWEAAGAWPNAEEAEGPVFQREGLTQIQTQAQECRGLCRAAPFPRDLSLPCIPRAFARALRKAAPAPR